MVDKKILIVDDDENFSYILSLILENLGYQSLIVSLGNDAFNIISKYEPDIIILDMLLPDINGSELSTEIKKLWNKIPIIMISAMCFNEKMNTEISHSADYILCKPVEKDHLRKVLDLCISSN